MKGYRFTTFLPAYDDEATILQARTNAINLILEVKTLMEFSSEGNEAKKQMVMDLESLIMDCNRALQLINPQKYGYVVRQTRMVRTA